MWLQCSDLFGWCRSSDYNCARLPTTHAAAGDTGAAHTHARARPCATQSLHRRTIWPTPARPTSVRSLTAAGGDAATTLPAPSPARPRAQAPSRAPTVSSPGASVRPPRLTGAAWPLSVQLRAWHAAPSALLLRAAATVTATLRLRTSTRCKENKARARADRGRTADVAPEAPSAGRPRCGWNLCQGAHARATR